MAATTGKLPELNRSKLHPHLFLMLLSCASMMMLFAAFTSAYVVRQSAGNWLEFRLPTMFYISTILIILSSITLHLSYKNFVNNNTTLYKGFLIATFGLGICFMFSQYVGWTEMNSIGVLLNTNPSGSFVYVISGVHMVHVFGGLAVLIMAMIHAFGLKHKVTEKRKVRFKITQIFWHFLGFLWIYILLFFVSQNT